MKIVDKEGNEVKVGDLILIEDDGETKKEDFDPIRFVRQARTVAGEARANRLALNAEKEKLKAFEDEEGNLLDPELARSAVERGNKALKDKDGLEAQLQAINQKWQEKLATETGKLSEKISGLLTEKKKATLLGAKPLQKTIHFAMGEKHLLTEFGHLLDDEGNPLDRTGKPIMSDADPTKPASNHDAAKVWIETHPDGKDKILVDGFLGGAGGMGGSGGSTDTGKGGYAGIVADAKK
jgi:pyruvate/2-oxoglutarate dehydrogenase complex dihydrolipoamide acyltransferase (E2) component